MTKKDAVRLLLNCYFDGDTLGQAVAFIKRCYSETPSKNAIQEAQKQIKEQMHKDWN